MYIVLSIDLVLVLISILISYYITPRIYQNIPGIQYLVLYKYLFISLGITLSIFFILKPYKGIVRYSTVYEFFRVYTAILLSSGLVFLYLYFVEAPYGIVSAVYSISFFVISLLGLIFFRAFIICTYNYLKNKFGRKATDVFVWGVSKETIIMSLYLNNTRGAYRVKGFIIDNDHQLKLRKNTRLPIIKNDFQIFKYQVKNVLFSTEELLRDNLEIAEKLIQQGIQILILQNVNQNDIKDIKDVYRNICPIQIDDLLGRPEIKINMDSIAAHICSKTILVTGAAGSIGSEIVRQLSNFTPDLVLCLDQAETPLHELSLELEKTKLPFKIIIADIRRQNVLAKIFKKYKPVVVYHAAAYKHVPLMEKEPCEAVITNVQGTKNIVDLSIQNNVETFIMISTDKAVNPTNIMGASKRIAEIYVQTCALDSQIKKQTRTRFITTRFGNVLGSNGSVIPLFKKQIENGGPITVTAKEITRYFMTIPEACRLVLEASIIGKSGYIYVFDMGEPVRIYDLAIKMIKLAGLRPEKDIKIEFSGLRPGEKLYEELLNDSEQIEDTNHHRIKVAKVREYALNEVMPIIDGLILLAQNSDTNTLVREMKSLMPEFISQNSSFMVYDCNIED